MKCFLPLRAFGALALCGILAACAGQQAAPGASGQGVYKVGNPYQVGNEWYYPHEDYSYDETGIASWYGSDFHGQATANGEQFNKDELTAAHKTLPLPSLARVTNLDNGRSIVVRINDRGPFSGSRLIDVSQRAAQLLGFEAQGTAKVRVQVLADESKAIADATRHYGGQVKTADAAPMLVSAAPQAAVETQTLAPVRTTPETHRQLLQTQPIAQAVQLPVTGLHQLYVQAGAFTVPENATRLQERLGGLGHASISTIVINGTKFYRVRVGPAPDVAHADDLLAKVRQTGAVAARTIVD